ncbi:hypothetical protein LTR84_008941 [Exophiala bonariae]|uniref:Uncharacterized protein n=1 Tax=Exophiala bonariae TaxID=1690606 RepID=A0AAV9MZN6_9EURO|nr:hypothetical protein LTR84_008941 [Exophiala bonariae]
MSPDAIQTTLPISGSANDPSDLLSSSAPSETPDKKADNQAMPSQTKPRRFLPQPIEETTRSSHKKKVEPQELISVSESSNQDRQRTSPLSTTPASESSQNQDSTKPRRFKPEPVETSTRTSRRKFAPEPIETSTRKSKDKPKPQVEGSSAKPRPRFTPEPIETTTRSSKEKKSSAPEDDPETTPRPRRRFAPEPIETTSTSRRRRRKTDTQDSDEEVGGPASELSTTSSRASSGPRKFSPELLETAKGSYRRVHNPSPTSQSPPSPQDDSSSGEEEVDEVADLEQSKFSAAALARKHPEITRQHSFVVPDLPMIESTTEDESSDTPSLSDSPSSLDVDNRKNTNHPDPTESYADYVLRLAADTVTEKELQEQAMAAYINERPHEPVDHFAISHDDDEDGPLPVPMFHGEKGVDVRTFRRSSAAELDLEMANMRKHHEQLEQAKRDLKADTAGQSRFSAAALATRHAMEAKGVKKAKKPRPEEDSELAKMRAAASPPMLGSDLVFPYTISPKMTRCDPDQIPRPRNADSDDEVSSPQSPHLWKTDSRPENNAGVGLWMGLCQASQSRPAQPQTGLLSGLQTPAPQTPAVERNNPFEVSLAIRGSQTPGRGNQTPGRRKQLAFLPLTPPRSQDGDDVFTSTIDRKLHLEKQIEDEFPARVITQIYNYLSLGYPSLAHMFDEELSKISRIPIDELRRDDYNVDAKGYVGAPEGDGADESEVVGKCKRWEALRLYVREWARQSPNFADARAGPVGAKEDWGARARKGSWGH